MSRKVLVTEEIADEAIAALKGRGYEVDVKLDLSPDELKEIIAPYNALVVRSGTLVTDELLEAAPNLKVIGRAGVTVDNIDLQAAAVHDVIVCNAPTSNIVSAAEHTMALMLAATRRICQANTLVHSGSWRRHCFMGTELYGKTLAIFGLGRVGSAVAERARAFGMNLVAYDPYCSAERAAKLDVDLCDDFDAVISKADVITVHLPRTSDTVGMFGAKEFAKMKKGVVLINSARGGIFDLDALADFIAAGKIAAAAIDVFEEEPCLDSPLHEFDNAILTPHISAVTKEAQIRAGEEIAEYVWAGLEGSIVPTAILPTMLPAEVIDELRPYVNACSLAAKILRDMLGRVPRSVKLTCEGTLSEADPAPLVAGLVDGFVSYKESSATSPDDAFARAQRHGIDVTCDTQESAREFASAIQIEADGAELAMTLFGLDMAPRIISMMGYRIDIAPAQHSLVFEYIDAPGRIGTIGTILGDAGVNITTMQIGTKIKERCALVYINVEHAVDDATMQALKDAIDFKSMWSIEA